jgi:hypothetical protein
MPPRLRHLCALFINIALPWLAYRLAFPHYGPPGALIASALPLLAWMSWDLLRHRHFDALSAIVLSGIALSLLVAVASRDAHHRALGDPMVPGLIGVAFLASLAFERPLVFYLARSTMTRENLPAARLFEQRWRERPVFAAYLRLMTLVWGLGLTGENLLRTALIWRWPDDPRAATASLALRYGVYGALTVWTFWCRRRIKRDALRYPDDTADTPASPAADPLARS